MADKCTLSRNRVFHLKLPVSDVIKADHIRINREGTLFVSAGYVWDASCPHAKALGHLEKVDVCPETHDATLVYSVLSSLKDDKRLHLDKKLRDLIFYNLLLRGGYKNARRAYLFVRLFHFP